MTDWRTLPKVELHLHLEGAAPPTLIRSLAEEQGVTLTGVFDDAGHYHWNDFAEFLKCYMAATAVIKTPEHSKRLVEEVLRQSAVQGVVYTEIFIAPHISGGGDRVAWAEHLAAMEEGTLSVPEVETRFISTAIRNLGPEKAADAARLTVEATSPLLVGFGMGGEERYLTAADFAQAFAIAGEAGLGLTCHAGEFGGPESVRSALTLGVSRLGHGVRAIEDTDLVNELADRQILLETNPGSNIALGVYSSWADHPVQTLREAGVPLCISTDDPPYFHTTLTSEYAHLNETFGWERADFDAQNRTALAHAFCDDATRTRLLPLFPET